MYFDSVIVDGFIIGWVTHDSSAKPTNNGPATIFIIDVPDNVGEFVALWEREIDKLLLIHAGKGFDIFSD